MAQFDPLTKAAPDLLAALGNLVRLVEQKTKWTKLSETSEERMAIFKARAAMIKAMRSWKPL